MVGLRAQIAIRCHTHNELPTLGLLPALLQHSRMTRGSGWQRLPSAGLLPPSASYTWRKVTTLHSTYPAPCMLSTWLRLDSITGAKASNSSTRKALHMFQIFFSAIKAYSRILKLWLKHHCSTVISACFRTSFCRERGHILQHKPGLFYSCLFDENCIQKIKLLIGNILLVLQAGFLIASSWIHWGHRHSWLCGLHLEGIFPCIPTPG